MSRRVRGSSSKRLIGTTLREMMGLRRCDIVVGDYNVMAESFLMRLTINYNDKSMEKGRAFARSRGEGENTD